MKTLSSISLGLVLASAAACSDDTPCDPEAPNTICTIAGSGEQGFNGNRGPATKAALYVPQDTAISPDGKWIGVQAMDGSNLTSDNPGRHTLGKVVLLAIRNGQAVKVAEAPGGEAAQGIVFTADSKYLIVQFNVEKQLALYAVNGGDLRDTGARIALTGGPSSLRTTPR